jgi:hypothetical protein
LGDEFVLRLVLVRIELRATLDDRFSFKRITRYSLIRRRQWEFSFLAKNAFDKELAWLSARIDELISVTFVTTVNADPNGLWPADEMKGIYALHYARGKQLEAAAEVSYHTLLHIANHRVTQHFCCLANARQRHFPAPRLRRRFVLNLSKQLKRQNTPNP